MSMVFCAVTYQVMFVHEVKVSFFNGVGGNGCSR